MYGWLLNFVSNDVSVGLPLWDSASETNDRTIVLAIIISFCDCSCTFYIMFCGIYFVGCLVIYVLCCSFLQWCDCSCYICVCFLMICSLLWLFMIYKSSLLLHEHSGPRKFHVCTLRPKMRKIVWQSTCENVTNQTQKDTYLALICCIKRLVFPALPSPPLASPLDLFCLVSSESINPMYTPLLLLCICDRI